MKNPIFSGTVLVSLMLIGACSYQQPDPRISRATKIEYLERIISIDENKYFSIPLQVSIDATSPTGYWLPATPADAIQELEKVLPSNFFKNDIGRGVSECRLKNWEQIDEFALLCGSQLCGRLPANSRDPSCTFFSRFAGWIEKAWLNGPCERADWTAETPLAATFVRRGISSCSGMSSFIIDLLLIKMADTQINIDQLFEFYLVRARS